MQNALKKILDELSKKSQPAGGLRSLAEDSLDNVSLVALADKMTYIPGEPVEITAFVLEGNTTLEVISASAQIERPDGAIDNLQLFDDGMHNDLVILTLVTVLVFIR